MISFKEAAATITVGVVLLIAGGAIVALEESANPVSKGRDFLAKKGYKNIAGGDPGWFNLCGKGIMSRHYTATDVNGETAERNVCFGPFGPYFPFFGK